MWWDVERKVSQKIGAGAGRAGGGGEGRSGGEGGKEGEKGGEVVLVAGGREATMNKRVAFLWVVESRKVGRDYLQMGTSEVGN